MTLFRYGVLVHLFLWGLPKLRYLHLRSSAVQYPQYFDLYNGSSASSTYRTNTVQGKVRYSLTFLNLISHDDWTRGIRILIIKNAGVGSTLKRF